MPAYQFIKAVHATSGDIVRIADVDAEVDITGRVTRCDSGKGVFAVLAQSDSDRDEVFVAFDRIKATMRSLHYQWALGHTRS
ncbi:hypothetical protein [Alsobacter sp. R-9]